MKARVSALVAVLIVTALLPIVAVGIGKSNVKSPDSTVESAVSESGNNNEILPGLIAAVCGESFCPEAVKAVAIIINTCLIADESSFNLESRDEYIPESELNNLDPDFYNQITDAVRINSNNYILIEKKAQYIPFSKISNGGTISNPEYPYIQPVASPWDCFADDYDKNAECDGVSLSGINYLCENGYTAEEAIKWYIPAAEIEESSD
ncbi:MAG: hypothetical protein IIZ36_00650 [Ruminococcus sp.]|nr:hypothetical protein [Ruminococcus sp.]